VRPVRDRPARRRLPDWARWNGGGGEPAWTVGIEEEVLLLDRVAVEPPEAEAAGYQVRASAAATGCAGSSRTTGTV
jgi:hypothetical protein